MVASYKALNELLNQLEANTLYIKKRGDVRKLIVDKINELKQIKESESLNISQEVYDKIQSYDNNIRQVSSKNE